MQMERTEIDESDSSFEEESYFVCPLTCMKVDPNVMLQNKRILQAVSAYIEKNPWAYEYIPNEEYKQVKLRP